MQILKVTDEAFRQYGKVIKDLDVSDIITAMSETPCPDDVVYEPSIESLEACKSAQSVSDSLYGGMPIQIGYCNGHNHLLNAVEYHRDSEINIAVTDPILTLGKEQNRVECVISYNDTTREYTAQIRQGDVEVSNRVLGKEPIDIKVYFEGDSTGYSLTELKGSDSLLPYVSSSKGLHLVFNRASGAFEKDTCTANNVLKEYCQKIVVSNGTRNIEITTVGKTGKILTK